MRSRVSSSFVLLSAAGAFAAALWSCSLDERDVQRVSLGLQPNGGGPGADAGGAGGALLAVSSLAVDFGNVTVGFPARARITLRNDGAAALAQPSVARAAGSASDFQIIQNRCGEELEPGGACDVRVQFVPSSPGATQARLDVGSANGGAVAVDLTGQGLVGGDLILAPALGSFEDFGGVDLGGVRQAAFTVSNPRAESSGALTFSVNRPEFTLVPAAPGGCAPGASALSGGQSCDIGVAFSPAERGATEGTLTATSPEGGSVSLTLSGRGLLAGALSASSETLDFGGVVLQESGQSALRFENVGDIPLILGGARLEPADASQFSILDSDCAEGMELAGGAGCSAQVQYRPTDIGVENAAELVLGVNGMEPLRLPLVGRGLQPGALSLAAGDASGGPDFGDVLVGEALTRAFTVVNPGAQSSGVLSLSTVGGFEVVTPPEGTDCIGGTTSLGTGESCTVRVSLAPTQRQPHTGALTVSSALAGAASLPLAGRGIIDAAIQVVPQVDFGRVLTNASATRTVTIENAGDRELPAPSIEVTSDSPAQQAAFSFESACPTPLAAAQACDVVVAWTPSEAVPHSANLRLVAAPGNTAAVLLLGQALAPGSLQLAVADAAGPDYGDVPLGTTATRTFVLTNPGNEPSGRITVSSDDSHFLPSLGDCNQGPPEGLVDGSSCTFSVVFTPDGSDALVANLSVQSPGAGRAGIELRARGRAAAALTATGNRDLGRARIGEVTLTQPENSFEWAVSNDGDLPTGTLQVDASNGTEFQIAADTCSNARVDGHSSCQMTIRFVPGEPPGTREATVTVTDGAGGSSATVALTGLAVRLAQPGQSCVNAECAEGVCTGGVCCDRACDRTCQACSAAGVCVDQSNQEACGTGGARCFGVDECELPAEAPCGSTADCGGDLQCKQCTTGGSRCTAPEACCGPCPGSTTCQGGTCGCSALEVDCGGNLCIPTNRADVCCPVSPDCPANAPVCRDDGQCVGCLGDADCGACGSCNLGTNTCQAVARGQQGGCNAGQVCNGNFACITAECTGPGQCGDCRSCDTSNFSCVTAGPPATCSAGRVCTAGGQCVQCINDGQCGPGQTCSGTNTCVALPPPAPMPTPPAPAPPPAPTPAPPAATSDPNCDRGLQSSGACCAASCGTCGGPGCSQRPGGTASCCTGAINDSGVFCTLANAPCILTQLTPNADPLCESGVASGAVCCAATCGECGGAGCSQRPGGTANCCTGAIDDSGVSCSSSGPPCRMD